MIQKMNKIIDIKYLIPQKVSKVAIAVSGGADSFALLHMVWQAGIKATALTVDHQLRPESASEAKIVSEWCKANNIEHHILPWIGEKPKTAIQASARNARRRLLCQAAVQYNIEHLLLGHQADDQAETMLMRLQRGTGLEGLKAMQPITRDKTSDVIILRPLLACRRAELREYCIDHNLPFIDDPSNENTDYERIRIRQNLAALPLLAEGVTKTTRRLARADDTLKCLAQNWFNDHAQFPENGQTWLPELSQTLPEICLRILKLACPAATLPQLENLVEELIQNDFKGLTLGEIWIRPKVMNKQAGFLFQTAPARRK